MKDKHTPGRSKLLQILGNDSIIPTTEAVQEIDCDKCNELLERYKRKEKLSEGEIAMLIKHTENCKNCTL